jgi:hypothetical protein
MPIDALIKAFSKLCNRKMSLQGGVLLIGSLLWDNAVRCRWRNDSLAPLETKVPVALKIRYGRESGEQRSRTYTMILSNHPMTQLGQGYLLGFQKKIESKEMLRTEATALAKAEGLWTNDSPFIAKHWGAVGLLVNPRAKNAKSVELSWLELFREYRCDRPRSRYDHSAFVIGDEPSVIDANGLLQISWGPEMNGFDFLLATPTVPSPKRPLTPKEIARKMVEANYTTYFDSNRANGITTFQDDEISYHVNHR